MRQFSESRILNIKGCTLGVSDLISKNSIDNQRIAISVDGLCLWDHDGLDFCADLIHGSSEVAHKVDTFVLSEK